MESFDNSHLFGTYYVGAMVVFTSFSPLKDAYRKYRLKIEVKDDLKAMREVLYRRYYRALMENQVLPDVLVMDGGKTQVLVAKEVLDELHLTIPIIGLVKDDHHKTATVINQDLETLSISSNSHLFLYLARIQEEVHRFAISYHRSLRQKGSLYSVLDSIQGVGEVRRKALIRHFGSLKKIKEASIEELQEIVGHDVATSIYEALREDENNE